MEVQVNTDESEKDAEVSSDDELFVRVRIAVIIEG